MNNLEQNVYKKPVFSDLSENELTSVDGGTLGLVLVAAVGYTVVAAFMVVAWAACAVTNNFKKKKK